MDFRVWLSVGLLSSSGCLLACSSDTGEAASSGGQSNTSGGTTGGSETGGSATGGSATGGSTTGGSTTGGSTTGGVTSSPEPLPTTDVPVLDSVVAAIDEQGAIAVKFEGRSGPAEARTIRLVYLDAAGNELGVSSGWGSWLARPNRHLGRGSAGHIEQAGRAFSGFMSVWDGTLTERPERVRVTVDDIEENPGEPVEMELAAPAPERRTKGAVCEPFEILDRCEGAAICDTKDASTRMAPTCQIPEQTCPLDLPELSGTVEASNEESPDATDASCTFGRGQLGNEQGHVFVASRSGSHRFRAEDIDYQVAVTLFVRTHCNYGRAGESELACVHLNDFGEEMPLVLDIDLEAGQTVFVYVEATWVGGGKYVLSVEEPD